MQVTELLFQRVKQLGAGGQFSLRPGYNVIVSGAAALRTALLAPLYPGPEDARRLRDGDASARVGVCLASDDGTPYRILREIGGLRQLQRHEGGKFSTVSDDDLEIESFLRVECGLPPSDRYAGFFVVDASELPSARVQKPSRPAAAPNPARIRELKQELEVTHQFEAVQDQLFRVQQRIHDLGEIERTVKRAEEDLAKLEQELGPMPWSAEQIKGLVARASRAKEETRKYEEAMHDVVVRRQKAGHSHPTPAGSLWSSPFFVLGILGGIAVDGVAAFLRKPILAFAGIAPFTAALVAVLHWIHADEANKDAAAYLKELKEREDALKRAYKEEQAPLKSAMRTVKADSPGELADLFRGREELVKKRDAAKKRVEELHRDPEVPHASSQIVALQAEKASLEAQVSAQGFARHVGEIEADLKRAMGLEDDAKGDGAVPEPEVPRRLIARAADLIGSAPDDTWHAIDARIAAHLSALTDGRIVSGKRGDAGVWMLTGSDGRAGPYHGLPEPLRDLAYAALRLAVIEAVAGAKRIPVFIDDAFASFEPQKRTAIGKLLKEVGKKTQILHRTAEPPPDGTADNLVQA